MIVVNPRKTEATIDTSAPLYSVGLLILTIVKLLDSRPSLNLSNLSKTSQDDVLVGKAKKHLRTSEDLRGKETYLSHPCAVGKGHFHVEPRGFMGSLHTTKMTDKLKMCTSLHRFPKECLTCSGCASGIMLTRVLEGYLPGTTSVGRGQKRIWMS